MAAKRKPVKKAGTASTAQAARQPGIMLHDWRKEQGLPLKHVAKDLRVSISVVSQWERAHRYPSMQNLVNIAKYLGVPMSRLFCTRKDCPNS